MLRSSCMGQFLRSYMVNQVPSTRLFQWLKGILQPRLAIEKIGDWTKLEILVQNQSFWYIVGARPTAEPRNSRSDNAAGIMIIWWNSPSRILQIHSVHQVAAGTPFYVPLRRRRIIITILHGFGTNCIVPSDWDSAPRCVCGPNFISDWIGESPICSVARRKKERWKAREWAERFSV